MKATPASQRELLGEVAEQIRKASADGGAQMRTSVETLSSALRDRESTIAQQQQTICSLIDKNKELVGLVEKVALTTTQLAVVDANKQIAIRRLEAEAEDHRRLESLVMRPLSMLAEKYVMGGGSPKSAKGKAAADRVIKAILSDDKTKGACIALVGIGDWTGFIDWADAQFSAGPEPAETQEKSS